jgi:hypothetical protein
VIDGEQRNYVHSETRAGVPWKIALGAGHKNSYGKSSTPNSKRCASLPISRRRARVKAYKRSSTRASINTLSRPPWKRVVDTSP